MCALRFACGGQGRIYVLGGSKKRPIGRVGQVTASAISGGNHNENGTVIL